MLLQPVNAVSLTGEFDPKKATGWGQYEQDPGLSVPADEEPSSQREDGLPPEGFSTPEKCAP